jgi:predicted TIM-barrel fold metal-dependent hydrolase
MRNGFQIIDTDTHVGPPVDVLYDYGSDVLQERRRELAPYEIEMRDGTGLSIAPVPYKRSMGEAPEEERAEKGGKPALKGKIGSYVKSPPEPGVQVRNSEGRLKDMDREGRDIDAIIPGTWVTAVTGLDDQRLAIELYAAYHRYMADYCSADPSRLKSTLVAPAADPEWAATEIKRLSGETWVAAVTPVLPEGVPVDDPSLHPIWRAMDEADLPILHHSFFYEPPYFPGYRDVWGHVAVARTAAHVWGAQRLLSYTILSGLLDQYPNLRIGFAECAGAWLPSWLVRLEAQADYLSASLPDLRQSPTDYARSGRVYCGLELYEGDLAQGAIDALGDECFMYQSDYPHDQCMFPESPDVVLGWGLDDKTLRKLLSENAARYLRLL